ncbi:MAG: squalene--hopene cyclase [Azospirillaceae bacterium]|nr:squalene--hopene cyclase [Azospirillaceae bacterium]
MSADGFVEVEASLGTQAASLVRQSLDSAIARAGEALRGLVHTDGHWVFELEADATIPAEYILLQHFLDEIDVEEERRIATYLRATQADHGGWPLFHDGAFDISASVKAYYALKIVGDPVDAPHMVRARDAIHAAGGAVQANVFTRIQLALFGQVPWRAVPAMPIEIMNLPRWFPFHLSKISYWSRTVVVPLLVLMALKPQARNPRGIGVGELFIEPPEQVREWPTKQAGSSWATVFRLIDRVLHVAEPVFPERLRALAIEKAVAFVTERLNGEDGLGAIYPAMANTVMMFDSLGYAKDDPRVLTAKAAIRKLLVLTPERSYCQPCLSPVWDTALSCLAMLESAGPESPVVQDAAQWLADRQVLDVEGDWAVCRPGLRPGGWAFQYANPHYPDLDDTAVVVMALDRADRVRYREHIERATEWVLGMQSRNGGWGAFDADNNAHYLNYIPFADHGALLDPPTADVTARCIGMLCQLGHGADHPAVTRGLEFLRREQEADGSWFGRWGTNYIYGTWSVLNAFNVAGVPAESDEVRRAVTWLLQQQRPDGGWGEDGATYWPERKSQGAPVSTASQTAWAVLGLMAAGETDNPAVERGIRYLVESQSEDGLWQEEHYTAVGFPRVFYLRYHGYRAFFPLWSLARYRELRAANSKTTLYGM